jgi:DNA recombination protein RmuC
METESVLMLVIGLVVGAFASWLAVRGQVRSARGTQSAADEQQRADLATARVELAEAKAAVHRAQAEIERARSAAARSDAERSAVHARLAEARAETGRAEAERDAARSRAEELAADRESLVAQFRLLSSETLEKQSQTADATAADRLKQTEELLRPMRQTLDAFNARLAEADKERAAMATDLRNQVQSVKLTGDELRRETAALVTALRKPQVRGAWGELQLKRVVELAGMVEHCDFEVQSSAQGVDGVIRPDMRVNLSDGKFVFVDSKMPLTSFLDAQQTDDEYRREHALGLFAGAVRTHVDALSGKQYWRSSSATPEFVVLFMASEALAAEALALMPDLHEYAAEKDIVIATPTTLIAMLRAVSYGWKQARLAGNAAEVSRLGLELYERLGTMGGHVETLGRSLATAVKAYNKTVGSLEGRVLVSARRFADLKVTAKPLDELHGVSEGIRPVAAVELVSRPEPTSSNVGPPEATVPVDTMLPESGHLARGVPELAELVGDDAVLPRHPTIPATGTEG